MLGDDWMKLDCKEEYKYTIKAKDQARYGFC